jgi:hypothetical protein
MAARPTATCGIQTFAVSSAKPKSHGEAARSAPAATSIRVACAVVPVPPTHP